MNKREAILSGVAAATEALDDLDVRETVESGSRGNVDVFAAILKMHAKLLFRPLEGLLGACLIGPGVIISTERSLPIQRFTAGHELGHVAMHHSFSLDGEEILKGELMAETDDMEIQANAFAAEFMLPRWLLAYHALRQKWDARSMENPLNVYQMSLRAGASYEATIWALEKHKIISQEVGHSLRKTQPRDIKQRMLPGYRPANWHRDVWLLTGKDQGAVIEGQPNDLFLFQLNEKTGGGFIWDFETLKKNGFAVVNDVRESPEGEQGIGADVTRKLTAHTPDSLRGELQLQMKRPWDKAASALDELQMKYDLFGKEHGLPRAQRLEFAQLA
jgi:hypothetical protein